MLIPIRYELLPLTRAAQTAIDAGYGPYYRGVDPEYEWYTDADNDGVVCE